MKINTYKENGEGQKRERRNQKCEYEADFLNTNQQLMNNVHQIYYYTIELRNKTFQQQNHQVLIF